MISLDRAEGRFDYRVAGVATHAGCTLLHRAETDDFWSLPGGRCELGETSARALAREWREEMGEEIQVERLLWVVESFFASGARPHHELGLYHRVALPTDSPHLDIATPFAGDEGGLRLTFRWFPHEALGGLRIYPVFLRAALAELPDTPRHVINDERVEAT